MLSLGHGKTGMKHLHIGFIGFIDGDVTNVRNRRGICKRRLCVHNTHCNILKNKGAALAANIFSLDTL